MFAGRIVPFGAAKTRVWGRLSAWLGHAGTAVPIAETEAVRRLTISTRIPRNFEPTGVSLVILGQEEC